jgi:hypothetical protein
MSRDRDLQSGKAIRGFRNLARLARWPSTYVRTLWPEHWNEGRSRSCDDVQDAADEKDAASLHPLGDVRSLKEETDVVHVYKSFSTRSRLLVKQKCTPVCTATRSESSDLLELCWDLTSHYSTIRCLPSGLMLDKLSYGLRSIYIFS